MYLKKKTLAEEYEISIPTVDNRLKLIRSLIGSRYPEDAVMSDGPFVRIRDDVFRDVMIHKNEILCGVAESFKPNEKHVYAAGGLYERV